MLFARHIIFVDLRNMSLSLRFDCVGFYLLSMEAYIFLQNFITYSPITKLCVNCQLFLSLELRDVKAMTVNLQSNMQYAMRLAILM